MSKKKKKKKLTTNVKNQIKKSEKCKGKLNQNKNLLNNGNEENQKTDYIYEWWTTIKGSFCEITKLTIIISVVIILFDVSYKLISTFALYRYPLFRISVVIIILTIVGILYKRKDKIKSYFNNYNFSEYERKIVNGFNIYIVLITLKILLIDRISIVEYKSLQFIGVMFVYITSLNSISKYLGQQKEENKIKFKDKLATTFKKLKVRKLNKETINLAIDYIKNNKKFFDKFNIFYNGLVLFYCNYVLYKEKQLFEVIFSFNKVEIQQTNGYYDCFTIVFVYIWFAKLIYNAVKNSVSKIKKENE